MFKVHPVTFATDLTLQSPVYWRDITADDARFFDKDGFELTPLEQRYYKANGVPLTNCLHHLACHKPWIEQTDFTSGVILDHSMILERYAFGGNARAQLEKHANEIPVLWKLIHTKAKWGLDFSVDYIKDGQVLDLFHIEIDSSDWNEIMDLHSSTSHAILHEDWEQMAKDVLSKKYIWEHMDGQEQSNWKANYFGFAKSEYIQKVF